LSVFDEHSSGLSDLDFLMSIPFKEFHSEFFLHVANLLTERGLSNVYTFSRAGEVQFNTDGDDVAHGAEFYTRIHTRHSLRTQRSMFPKQIYMILAPCCMSIAGILSSCEVVTSIGLSAKGSRFVSGAVLNLPDVATRAVAHQVYHPIDAILDVFVDRGHLLVS
jgi:hypothetical protein